MEHVGTYILLFGLIVILGQVFHKSVVPLSLILVITGMVLSFIFVVPATSLFNSDVVLNILLPLLIYQITSSASWKDVKHNLRPIMLLSVGHVVFIAALIAIVAHTFIPNFGWPLAFVLGAALSPPDDVAFVSLAETLKIPNRLFTILQAEGVFNDATALILFRFGLAAVIANQFSLVHAVSDFTLVVVGETIYGLIVGYVVGELRMKIQSSGVHMIASILTPFLAYYPAVKMGGSGVLATAITGFVISNVYALKFTPEFRLVSRALWPMISFAIDNILFLLLGLNMRLIVEEISSISLYSLFIYAFAVVFTVIIGRFLWVFLAVYLLPRALFPYIRKKDPYPPWQFPFLISWSGMRGAISLAAALAIPTLPMTIEGANVRSLVIFLTFCVIAATLLFQGLTLPWIIKVLGISKFGVLERYNEHLSELRAKLKAVRAALRWLVDYKKQVKDNPQLVKEVNIHLKEYQMKKNKLKEKIENHGKEPDDIHDEIEEIREEIFVLSQLIDIERQEILDLWKKEKINLNVRNKLIERLDHRAKHVVI